MKLKVAIVGCGKIADGHVEEIQKLGELAELVAVCDREPIMAEQLAVRYGIGAQYGNFDRMIAVEKPDVVHIATPPASHLPLAEAALDAGCHVFVEKPLTLSHADSSRLIERAKSAERLVTVGYTSYFEPPALVMRDLVADGVIGDPVHVESYYGYDLSGAFGKALLSSGNHWVHRLPGKLLHNTIDHMLNKLVEFIDDDHPAVVAHGYKLREQRFGDLRDDMHDELRMMVTGSRVSAYCNFSAHIKPAGHFCRVFGTKNSLTVDYVSRTVTLDQRPTLPSAIGRVVPAFEQALQFAREGARNVWRFAKSDYHYFAGLKELFRRFYTAIQSDGPPPIPYRDMLRIAQMLDDIFTQLDAQNARGAHAGGAA